jgi:hypothetical protein
MVVISQEQEEVLEQLGRYQGRSKASYLRELLDEAMPIYRAILPMMKAHAATIEGQPVAVRDLVTKVLTGAYGDEGQPLFDALQDAAERMEAAEAVKGAPSGARAHRSPPRRAPAQPRKKRNSAR